MINKKIEIVNREFVHQNRIENNLPGIMKVYNVHDVNSKGSETEIREIDGRPIRYVAEPVEAKSLKWENTAEYNDLWDKARYLSNKIREEFGSPDNWKRNIEHMPPGTTELFDLMRIDITRRVMMETDLVPFFANEITNEDFDNPITAQWLYDYVAPFQAFNGMGEKVNQVYTRLGDKTPVYFELAGVGFQQDLYNMLFNRIFDMQKVNAAVARFYILRRNANVIHPIINFSFPTNKIVNYATGTNISVDQMYYDTMIAAIKTLGMLLDFQTKQEIDIMSGMTLFTHSTRVFPWLRAISGQLLNGDQVKNLTALTSMVNRIIPYNTKRFKYFEKDVIFYGCDTDYSYLFVKDQNWYLTKRSLTHKTGPGDAFALESDKEAWYTVDGQFNSHFLGGDEDDPADETAAGDTETICQTHGYIIKIENPPDVGNESET